MIRSGVYSPALPVRLTPRLLTELPDLLESLNRPIDIFPSQCLTILLFGWIEELRNPNNCLVGFRRQGRLQAIVYLGYSLDYIVHRELIYAIFIVRITHEIEELLELHLSLLLLGSEVLPCFNLRALCDLSNLSTQS